MAQLTACDRCGTTEGLHEQVIVRGARVDLCPECMDATFSPWLQPILERLGSVPAAPTVPPTRADAWPRPAQHGHTAAAIEASQSPAPAVTDGGAIVDADVVSDS